MIFLPITLIHSLLLTKIMPLIILLLFNGGSILKERKKIN